MNQRGFMLLSTVWLTLIVSFVAMMALQTFKHVKDENSFLRLHAINLANEQFAMIESLAAQNRLDEVKNFNGNPDDLKSYGLYRKNELVTKPPINFEVTTTCENADENLFEYEVIVTWEGNLNPLKFTKTVRVAKQDSE